MASEGLGDLISTTAERLLADPEVAEAIRNGAALTSVVVVRSTGKPVRANLSLDKDVVTAIDAAAERRGVIRSAMVEIIVRHQLSELA